MRPESGQSSERVVDLDAGETRQRPSALDEGKRCAGRARIGEMIMTVTFGADRHEGLTRSENAGVEPDAVGDRVVANESSRHDSRSAGGVDAHGATLAASTVLQMAGAADRTTLVVIFGGRSAEHDVSCVTAAHVIAAVDRARHDVVAYGIDRSGRWHRAVLPTPGDPVARLEPEGPAASPAEIATHRSVVVVPLVHGPLGEDGTLQGLCEILDVAYVGSGVLACALAMDKAAAKQVLGAAGIAQVRHSALREDQIDGDTLARLEADLGYPMFVKPANMGSSVGVAKVRDRAELVAAAAHACTFDEWVIFEEAVTAREIEVAVIGNRSPRASLAGEIVPGHEFYDYEDKYEDDGATLTAPADLPPAAMDQVRRMAVAAYEALRCEGMARVDFFYEPDGRGFLCNEVNTIPGFTPISMYPRMWRASGLEYPDLIDELVALALERHARRKRNTDRS